MADVESRKEKVEKRKRKSGWKKIAFAVATVVIAVGGTLFGKKES